MNLAPCQRKYKIGGPAAQNQLEYHASQVGWNFLSVGGNEPPWMSG